MSETDSAISAIRQIRDLEISPTVIPFIQIIPLIKEVAEIHNEVTELYNTPQQYKQIIKLLRERIAAANAAVSSLQEVDLYTLACYTNLQRLIRVLQEMKKFIEVITKYNAMQKYSAAKYIEPKFNNLCKEYESSMSSLNTNLMNDFNMRTERESKILREDIKELLKFQTTLADSIHEIYRKLFVVNEKANNAMGQTTTFSKMSDTEASGATDTVDVSALTDLTSSPVVIPFIQFVPLIKDVAEILNKVTDLYSTAQFNKNKIKILFECIIAAHSLVSILRDEDLYNENHYAGLQRLVQSLQGMKKFIEEITQYNTMQKVLGSPTIELRFKDLCTEYDYAISSLNSRLMIGSNMRAVKENEILRKDIEELLKFQTVLADSINDIHVKVNDIDENVNMLVERVSEVETTMQNLDEEDKKIDNIFQETLLPFNEYEENSDEPRINRLRKYIHVKTRQEFAFKIVDKEHKERINQVKNQVKILKKLKDCQNVIHFYGLTYDESQHYLVTEWAENRNLRKYIFLHGQNIRIKLKIKFAYDIVKGLNFINSYKIFHQDIRAENIVITENNVAKITNFNLSKGFEEASDNLPIDIERVRYKSPEMLKGMIEEGTEKSENKKYDTKCEVYSFGILLWEIAECRIPYEEFEDFMEISKKVVNGYREPFTPSTTIPKKYQNLVVRAVYQNPGYRPMFSMVLRDLQELFNDNTIMENKSHNWIKNSIKEKSITYMEWNELTRQSKIGSGHFGSVFKVYWSKTKNYVVCKKLINLTDIQNQILEALQHEIQIHIRAHACENIIRFLGITQDPQNDYCMVMEYADGGDLRIYLEKKFSTFDWDKKYQLAIDIANGLHYLHKANILHRDLHAKNIVIQKGRAKITDFGNAKGVETQTKLHKGVFGMAPYMAPELLKPDNSQLSLFSMKSDIYSLGVLLWELSSGYPPFKNQVGMDVIFKIINGTREKQIPETPSDYYDLYTACWNGNPEERPIIEDVYDKLKKMLPKNDEIVDIVENKIEDNKDSSSTTLVNINQKDYDDSESNLVDYSNEK